MTSNTLHCHICQLVLADSESTIKQHISSIHLSYWPYDCRTCNEEGNIFKAAAEEVIDAHIAVSHRTTNSGYHATKDQMKEIELKAAIEECRHVSTSQLSSADTTVAWHQNFVLNDPADNNENFQVTRDSKELLRRVFISLGDTSNDAGSVSTEIKQEDPESTVESPTEKKSRMENAARKERRVSFRDEISVTEYFQEEFASMTSSSTNLPQTTVNASNSSISICAAPRHPKTLPQDLSAIPVHSNISVPVSAPPNPFVGSLPDCSISQNFSISDRVPLNNNESPVSLMQSTDAPASESSTVSDGPKNEEIKKFQMFEYIALESARPELEQNYNEPANAEALPEANPDLTHHHALPDSQPTLSLIVNQRSVIKEEPTEEQKIIPNGDLWHHSSINLYPGAISTVKVQDKRENNTAGHFHRIIEEVQDSDVTRASVTTLKSSNNDNARSSQQNEFQTAVDSNASGVITATVTSAPIPAEIPSLNCSKRPKSPIAFQKSLQYEEIEGLRLRGRKQIYNDIMAGHDLPVERKRSRLSCTEQNLAQIQESDSVATSIVDGRSQQECGFAESSDESATSDDDSEYEFGESTDETDDDESDNGFASKSSNETLINKNRAHGKKKEKHRVINKNKVQVNSRPKACLQLNKKRQISGEKRHKCKLCQYATNHTGHLARHMRAHAKETPFKCKICSYAATQHCNLIRHERAHSEKKPHKCHFCNFASNRNDNLNQHMQTQHTAVLKFYTANSEKNAKSVQEFCSKMFKKE